MLNALSSDNKKQEVMSGSIEKVFFNWPESFQAGTGLVGGKGWNLARLDRYGFEIPNGGVLTAQAYQDFVTDNKLEDAIHKISSKITIDNIGEKETQNELELLRKQIKAAQIPPLVEAEIVSQLERIGILEKPVAVRSSASVEDSAGASFAGIHDSFLNVRGSENILDAIKGCYASLWTTRAVAYRRKMKIADQDVIPAVVIMEMVEAKASGIAFTCDPKTGREDLLVVNANFGLGESVVGGMVEPDEYYLNCEDFPLKISYKKIGEKEGQTVAKEAGGTEYIKDSDLKNKQVLDDDQIMQLGLLVLRVYMSLGQREQHQDIEWVFNGQDFILVQARPVTKLPRFTVPELKNQPDIWSNANLRDAMPMVFSTIGWRSLDIVAKAVFEAGGYSVPSGMQFIKLFYGRAYQNLAAFQWFMYDAFGVKPKETNSSMGGHQPEIAIPEENGGINKWRKSWRMIKMGLAITSNMKKANRESEMVANYSRNMLKQDYQAMPDKELLNTAIVINKKYVAYVPIFSSAVFSANISNTTIVNILEKIFPGQGKIMANALLAGMGNITSALHGYRLVEMAEIARRDSEVKDYFSSEPFNPLIWEEQLPENTLFKKKFREFISEYGHRGVYEIDLINPRWREDSSYLFDIIRSTMDTADLTKIKAIQQEKRDLAWQKVNKLPFYKRWLVNYWVTKAYKSAEMREMTKSVVVMLIEPLRLIIKEEERRIARRGILKDQNDIFHCAVPEIYSIFYGYWDGKGLDILVKERKERRKELEALSPPDLIIGEVPQFAEPAIQTSDYALPGLGVAAGKASGSVSLIHHPNEGRKLKAGDVLVAPSTDPAWTPLFLRAAAVVMETGGYLSHGAIVAREYGIPAVVNIPGVMKILKDGQEIVVDGDDSKIFI